MSNCYIYFREREKAGIGSMTGDIPPLMGDWDFRATDEDQEYSSTRRRSPSNDRFDKSPYRRSRSR